jgi:hypothetical protein
MAEHNVHYARAQAALGEWAAGAAQPPAVSGVFECHIFCDPLDPSPGETERFARTCEGLGLKALCLGLDFVGRGVINVLQTTRYYECPDVPTAVRHMLRDGAALGEYFAVTRLKLEAVAENPGVPRTDAEAREVPGDTYFEYHIKVDAPASPETDALLKRLAADLTRELGLKVPFSCNNMPGKSQRFLNARTYGLGYDSSAAVVRRVTDAMGRHGVAVAKVIREFIPFDTNKDLDRGWLEF